MRLILFILLSTFNLEFALGAACCSGGASFPSLILSDDKAQLGSSASSSKVIGDAPSSGIPVFRSSKDDEWIHTLSLDGAALLSDRWQVGGTIPLVYRSHTNEAGSASAWGFGDVSTTLGYEVLPEYTYSKWKPRGFLFLQATLPTGGNSYDATKTFEVDARGKGFYSLALGTFLIKTLGSWDSSLRLSYHYSLARSFNTPNGREKISPGQIYNGALSIGYSPGSGDWRFGISENPTYTTFNNSSDYKLIWTTSLDITRLLDRKWAVGIAYNDQTLLGPAKNTNLERSLALSLRYKWER